MADIGMTYADLQDWVEQFLQDASAGTYTTTITDLQIPAGLKELAKYDPHIVPVLFKIESRTGTDVTGTANKLTDLVELQFVDLVAETGKVVHNTTDNTWATIWAYDSTSVYSITADIMDANENYKIYDRNCWNEKQIYIGDVLDYIGIDSVEYPLGTKRNWKVYGRVLEIDVDSVEDSDPTADPLNNIDVLVRFEKPHRVCKLTDINGLVQTTGAALATSLKVYSFTDSQVVRVGDEFTIAGHRQIYTATATTTFTAQASTGSTLTIYPGLEAEAVADRAVTFTESTLSPDHENIIYRLIASRCVQSESTKHINTIPKGGQSVWRDYLAWARDEYDRVVAEMKALRPPRTKRRYATD